MNNASEYLDETKSLDPKIQKDVNASNAVNEPVRDKIDGLTTPGDQGVDAENRTDFETVDFTSVHGLQTNSKHFVRVQDICNLVYNHLRVPFCSDNFRPYIVPKSKQGVPVIPYNYYISSNGVIGGGANTFTAWMNAEEETQFNDYIVANEPFTVKMAEELKAQLMTKVSIWSNEYLDKGVRDSRARPNAVLGDWAWALTPTFSMTTRNIRTDVVACWMYGSYTPTSPNEKITIINASDLRTFMNTGDGNYWPVEQNTLCLALGKTPTADLSHLALLAHKVIIDFDNSMNGVRGTATTYNGVTAYEIALNSVVNYNDSAVAIILNNTYSGIDLQWALLANTLPLASMSANSIFGATNNTFNLRVFENSICDQFINFYATKRDSGNKLPVVSTNIPNFVQSWRLFRTFITNRTLVELGYVGNTSASLTYGKNLEFVNYLSLISGCFEYESLGTIATPSPRYRVLWLPYEMWISNGANLQLDDEDYVDGQSSVLVNTKYLCPRSQVVYTLAQWSDTTAAAAATTIVDYWIPNQGTSSTGSAIPMGVQPVSFVSCFPRTVPCYKSTSETQSMIFDNLQQIDFAYTNTGKTDNTVYRKKLVFNSAVKN